MNRLRIATLAVLGVSLLPGQELRDYDRKVTEFTLSNGLHFILLERHQAPVVSFRTYINAGSSQDPAGQSGLANLAARLAFDGTESIGTKDWAAEKKALDDVETAFDRVNGERNKGSQASEGEIAALEAEANSAVGVAQRQQDAGEFLRVLQENGAVHVSSRATPDAIETSYSLPSNRIELWFLMESDRLAHPVFRNFYRERDKVLAETKAVAGSNSPARLEQLLLTTAFESLPYRNPLAGWPADLERLRASDLKSFLGTYASPGNIVISIVGDVDPGNARRLAEKYFAAVPSKPLPPAPRSQEAVQFGPKTAILMGDSPQQLLLMGYKRPGETSRDDAALDFVQFILGDSQTGWLHLSLVDERHIAQQTDVQASFPASRYLNLFVLSVVPAKDHTVEENRIAVESLIARLQRQPVDDETLARVKSILRVRIARSLGSNERLAALLPLFYIHYGDWRKLFTLIPQYEQMTAADVQRAAGKYLALVGRTTVYMTNSIEQGGPGAGGQQ